MSKENLNIVKTEEKKKSKLPFDLESIIKKAQEAYPKSEKGLSQQITTGAHIKKLTKDSDFITWKDNQYWQDLTGMKGLPFGFLCQVSGAPDSGKTSLLSKIMKAAQDQGVFVILLDSERKFSAKRFSTHIGGNVDDLAVIDTNNILNGAKAVAHLVGAVKEKDPKIKILIAYDSVGSGLTSTEDDEDTEDYSRQPGVAAKETSYAIKKFCKLMNKYLDPETGQDTIATLVVNQTYAMIGSVGQKERGGNQLYYMSSLILQLTRKKDLIRVRGGRKLKHGILTRAKVKKNHLFEGEEAISELDIVVSAGDIQLADEVKKDKEVVGWEDPEEND